ncbi:MAG: TolC family protein [Myxococcota bacterium]|jgi:outer membrane protein TolC|nr:TolC family protein [Myxococcota bacterium]
MQNQRFTVFLLVFFGAGTGFAAEPAAELELLTAVQTTLLKEPGIALKRQNMIYANALYQSASSVFDTTLSLEADYSRSDTPLDRISKSSYENINSSIADSRTLRLGLEKTFRQGLTLSPGMQITRSENLLAGTGDNIFVPPITNRATLSINFVQPLLRGAGAKSVAAHERSTQYSAMASKAEFEFLLSQKVLATTRAFWGYYAAFERVGMLKKTEKRAEQLTRETQILIDAAEWPAADIQQTKASLAQKKKNRIRAEQSLLAARHRLAMAMGLDFSDFDDFGQASRRYPEIRTDMDNLLREADKLADFAIKHRKDFLAKSFMLKSAQISVLAAERNRLPELNLTGSLGYSGIEEGAKVQKFGDALYTDIPGMNGSVNLVFNWPIENRFYDAAYLQSRALVEENKITLKDAERQIRSEVKLAISEVVSSAAEVQAADFSAKSFDIAVVNEKKKLKAGLSTLIDLIQMENNAISARLSLISALENYADTLAQLRYQLGSLILIDNKSGQVTWETLTTVPQVED